MCVSVKMVPHVLNGAVDQLNIFKGLFRKRRRAASNIWFLLFLRLIYLYILPGEFLLCESYEIELFFLERNFIQGLFFNSLACS